MTNSQSRRSFLTLAASAAGVAACSCGASRQKEKQVEKRPPRILVRSLWQAGNIGDAAATSGLLRLVEMNIPRCELSLWPMAIDDATREFITRHHPEVKIVADDAAPADFLLHGSGRGVAAASGIEAWRKRDNRPYGLLGITVEESAVAGWRGLLDGAAFVFARERASLRNLEAAGLPQGKVGYAPDAAFSLKASDEPAAKRLLQEARLEAKKFIAVVPRQGESPVLRGVVTRWLRETGNKVLLCAETAPAMKTLEPLRASLPPEVRDRVVRLKAFWSPDEASSVYRRAVAVISEEYYSPVIAAINDTPCLYIHGQNAGIEGRIWDDLGLKRWYFEAGGSTGAEVWQALKSLREHYPGVQVDVHEAVIGARRLQTAAIDRLRLALA